MDTRFSSAHHLALAQRDSGSIDPALKFFLRGLTIEEVIGPKHLDVDRGGSFYGNIGRCLHLMGQVKPALACYRKSARLIEQEDRSAHLENQAYIRQWVGELLQSRSENRFARQCFEAAIEKWSVVSPPKATRLREMVGREFGGTTHLVDAKSAEANFQTWIDEGDR